MTKTCSACGLEKDLSFYCLLKKGGTQFGKVCRVCRTSRQRRRFLKHAIAFHNGKALPDEQECSRCGETKPRVEFSLARNTKTGLDYRCRACKREMWQQLSSETKKYNFDKGLWEGYRLTRSQFDQMLIEQSGRCGICNDPMFDPHIDHCHKTGEVRGLLCTKCNLWLAPLDEPAFMVRAEQYLAEHRARKFRVVTGTR